MHAYVKMDLLETIVNFRRVVEFLRNLHLSAHHKVVASYQMFAHVKAGFLVLIVNFLFVLEKIRMIQQFVVEMEIVKLLVLVYVNKDFRVLVVESLVFHQQFVYHSLQYFSYLSNEIY